MPLTPSKAERLIRDHFPKFRTETLPLDRARGRILHQAVCADRDLPPFDRVTLDGYAVRAGDCAGAQGVGLDVCGFQAAGMAPLSLPAGGGQCIEVATGAVLPSGADCVVPVEAVERRGDSIQILDTAWAVRGGGVHARGSDARAGGRLLQAGAPLSAAGLAVATSVGCLALDVASRPAITIVCPGDELVAPGGPVQPWQVRRSNDVALGGALAAAGFGEAASVQVGDKADDLEKAVGPLLSEGSLIILSGGISVGRLDLVAEVLARLGVRKVFHGVQQRPGKPMYFGVGPDYVPVFALPGNPASAFITLHRYVIPALLEASGAPVRARRQVVLAEPLVLKQGLAHFVPVRLSSGPRAEVQAHPLPLNTSGDFLRLAGSDGFIELPGDHAEFSPGHLAEFWPWA